MNHSNKMTARRASGFTLMELLVVLGILALLATLMIPKIINIYDRARSSTQAYSIADIQRQINNYYGLNHKYPEGWDTLLTAGGTAVTPSTIYSKLAPVLTAATTTGSTTTNGYLSTTVATLTTDQMASLNAAGISHLFAHDTTASDVNFSGVERHHLGDTASLAHDGSANINKAVVIDTTTGSKGLDLLVNAFGLAPNIDATAATTRITSHTYVVLGLGFKSSMVQAQIDNSPVIENSVSQTSYSRALCVFEIPNSGQEKAELVGVFGPDGRSIRTSVGDYNNINGQQPH